MSIPKTKIVHYSDLVNFRDQSNPEQLWPNQRKISSQPPKHYSFSNQSNAPGSKLLSSALVKIREDKRRSEMEAISDLLSQQSSNFIFSRENTPANYSFQKKKNKNRGASQLFDIQSKGSQARRDDGGIFEGLILYPSFSGISDVVYNEVMGKEKKISNNLMNNWKDCLMHEDKQQIFGKSASYTFPKVFPINQLEKGFNQIYGSGKKRSLRIGEQSLLINHMERYLEKCNSEVTKIARKDFDIISDILKAAKLQELEQLPICLKQIQLIWKILATRWRYSGKLETKNNRMLESALINGRSNFWDLRKQNAITKYLLSLSNQNEIL